MGEDDLLIGPVFAREMALAPRRPRLYIARVVFCLLLLFLISTAWLVLTGTQLVRDLGDLARFGGALFQLGPDVVTTQQARLGIQSLNTAELGSANGRLYQLASGGNMALATDPNSAFRVVDKVINKIAMLRGRHRRRLLMMAARDVAVQPVVKAWLGRASWPKKVRVQIDVDPYSFF